MQTHKSFAKVAHFFEDPNLFHLNRHSVSRAVAIGLFVAMTPVYGHLFIAIFMAIWLRANIAISAILIWITNPLTLPAVLLFQYWIGAGVLGIEETLTLADFQLANWKAVLNELWQPLLIGAFVTMIAGAMIGYYSIQWLWKLEVASRWRKRKKRLARK